MRIRSLRKRFWFAGRAGLIVLAGLLGAGFFFSCEQPVEIRPEAYILFKLDARNNISFVQFQSGREQYPDYKILVKAIESISEPENFEILTIVPYGKKSLLLVTRKHGLLSAKNLGETWERIDTGLPPEALRPFDNHP